MVEELYIKDVRRITEMLSTLTGFPFDKLATITLKRTIVQVLRDLYIDNLDDFCNRLQEKEFLNDTLLRLIVPGTEFFRDASVWKKLNRILEEANFSNKSRVLVTGLGNATELYSLLILLKESKQLQDVQVDVSSVYFEKKEEIKGLCFDKKWMDTSVNNFKSFNPNGEVNTYFINNDEKWYYNPEMIEKVNEFYNFKEVEGIKPATYDLIWSRNQMIYWEGNEKVNYFKKLNDLLKLEGILGIGQKEKIPSLYSDNYRSYNEDYKLFKKIK